MDAVDKWKIVLGVVYLLSALLILGIAYFIFLKRFKRAKLEALNTVSLITSRENVFKGKTRFLIVAPNNCLVKVDLLDHNEQLIRTLIEVQVENEEHPFDFDPAEFESGKYYLSLTSDNAKILRSITVEK